MQPKIPKTDFGKIIDSKIDKKELFHALYECDENYFEKKFYLLKNIKELKYEGGELTEKQKNEIFNEKSKEVYFSSN